MANTSLTSEAKLDLRKESLERAISLINGANLAMAATNNGPWIPEKGRVSDMAEEYYDYLKGF